MIDVTQFGNVLAQYHYSLFTGVPCSFFKPLINYAACQQRFIMAANEGDGVAIATGAYLGGLKPVFLCQNSGLGNAISPLTSLVNPFKIPMLGLISLRGEPGTKDEPQHQLMGQITPALLELCHIPWAFLSPNANEWTQQIEQANQTLNQQQSYFFLVRKQTFLPYQTHKTQPQPLQTQRKPLCHQNPTSKLTRSQALRTILDHAAQDCLFVTTTGYTSRTCYSQQDQAQNFYMVGSMGCAAAIGLGLALAMPTRPVVVIDGDGALLMRMGLLSTVGYYQPKNLMHIVLDNQMHESTGGQYTTTRTTQLAQVAYGCHYQHSVSSNDPDVIAETLKTWQQQPELYFLHIPTVAETQQNIPRPNQTPEAFKQRFQKHIQTFCEKQTCNKEN